MYTDEVIEYNRLYREKLEATTHGVTAIETTKALGRRVEKLEAETIPNLSVASVEQHDRIEKLEAVLRDVMRCLIDGKVERMPHADDEFHEHRILGCESVQTMVEVYHRLKTQMGDPGYDTP